MHQVETTEAATTTELGTTEPTTTEIPSPIESGFTQTSEGCFYVETDVNKRKNWIDAEAFCQTFGNHVHLARLDTQQVCLIWI